MKIPHRFLFSSILTLFIGIATQSLQAAVVANFTGGNGSSSVDQYIGIAGNGWSNAWSSRNGSNGTTTISVLSTNPIHLGGGGYLNVDYLRTASGGTNRTGVARTFSNSVSNGGIDNTNNYSISFSFRPDTLTGWSTSADQIAFSSEISTNIGSPGADAPWSLIIRGDGVWNVFNGNGSGGGSNVSLGIGTLKAGSVYEITVDLDPTTSKYDLTVITSGSTFKASTANSGNLLGFRTNSSAANATVLQFRTTNDAVNDRVQFSIDNIAVIPEPSSVALSISSAVALGFLLKRRIAHKQP